MRASAEILRAEKKIPETLELLADARAKLENAGSTHGLQYTAVLTDIAATYYRTGRYAKALSIAEICAAAFERNGRGGTVGHTITLSNIATTLNQMGEVLAADERYRENLVRETAAHSGPPRGRSAVNRGAVLLRLEKYNEAKEILDIGVATAREDGSRTAEMFALVTLARMYIHSGDLEEADKALSATDDRHFASAPDVVRDSQHSISAVRVEWELARGNLPAARARADALLSSIGYPAKKDLPLLKTLLPTLSRLALSQGDAVRAQSYATEALNIARSVARPEGHSADIGEASLLLLKARQRGGQRLVPSDLEQTLIDLRESLGPQHSLTREARALQTTL